MTRRVPEGGDPVSPQANEQGGGSPKSVHLRGVRVAGEVRMRDVSEVQRIAGALEVAAWIRRVSLFARPVQQNMLRVKPADDPDDPGA